MLQSTTILRKVLTVVGKLLNPVAIRPARISLERHITLNKIPSRAVNRASAAGSDFSSRSNIGN